MDLKLRGRSALITGGSRGIGLAAARRLASEGVSRLHLVARDAVALESAAQTIAHESGANVVTHALDLQAPGACDTLAAQVLDLDILVNNAGSIPRGTLLDVDEATWRAGWDGKVFGYINLTRAVYRNMRERGRGVIVNVVGVAGESPNAEYIAAGSGNAALIYFTEALGSTSLADGIRVVGINPGPTLTDRYIAGAKQRALKRFGSAERYPETFANLPLERPAEPDEVAALVAYLASDVAGYISGTLVRFDGGLTIKRNIG
jgi:NAD(P)-dependent dehydrogenase (short-subunit alcohol dehydrogenase family)